MPKSGVADRPIRTFLDSGVLIAGARGDEQAAAILDDPNRFFLSSPFIRHELCPKALFNRRHEEYRWYQEYFQNAVMFADVRLILERAGREAAKSGLSAMDSLHIAAAHLLKADEFITTENPRKSIYRTSLVEVKYLFRR